MPQQTAQLNNLRIAPRKVRLVANLLKGLPVSEAEAQLILRHRRSSEPLLKLIRSAVANAKNNQKLNPDRLFVKSILVNGGPMLKRYMPRAQGRAGEIQKKTSHITLVLEESAQQIAKRFVIVAPEKKAKKPAKTAKPKTIPSREAAERERPKEKGGFFRKIFSRKAI